jgi:hypothetical protein
MHHRRHGITVSCNLGGYDVDRHDATVVGFRHPAATTHEHRILIGTESGRARMYLTTDVGGAVEVTQTVLIATLVLPFLMSIGIYRSLRLVRRWRLHPEMRPAGTWGEVWRVASSAIGYLVVAVVCLVVVPRITGVPTGITEETRPYFDLALLISGVIGLIWAFVWPQIAVHVLRPGEFGVIVQPVFQRPDLRFRHRRGASRASRTSKDADR